MTSPGSGTISGTNSVFHQGIKLRTPTCKRPVEFGGEILRHFPGITSRRQKIANLDGASWHKSLTFQ
jgi:hypothetical protein